MEIKIDKNVPMPDGVNRETKWPFADMEVGDSFFAPGHTSNQMTNAAAHWRKKNGWSFSCRNTEEEGVKGARVWRVK